MVNGVQILGIAFSLLMLYFTYLYFKRKEFTKTEAGSWCAVWIVLILLLAFPGWIGSVTENFGFARAFDVFTVLGFIFLLTLCFTLTQRVHKLDRKLRQAIQQEALSEFGKREQLQ